MTWITNFEAPYRRPIWEDLGRTFRLRVLLLENNENLRRYRSTNRPRDWEAGRHSRSYRVSFLKSLAVRRGETAFYLLTWNLFLPRGGIVVLGGWESPVYWQALFLAWLRGARLVGFYESTAATNRFSTGPIASARAWFFRRLDAIVVPGDESEDAIRGMGVRPSRIFKGFNPADGAAIERVVAAATRPQNENGHRFLFVGQLIERKNVESVIVAFSEIRNPGDKLVIVGDGDRRPALEQLVNELGLDERVDFAGYETAEGAFRTMALSHTLVMPSHSEVWGMVVVEAMLAGCHVVVSKAAGVAAAVAEMPGVFFSEPTVETVGAAMAESRRSWSGSVQRPELSALNASAFADVFRKAFRAASDTGLRAS
ncbi:glycosyltransferase [Cnuibacter physcomitrellae]|uniref:glycosyltransferase n=1 Tax=Cnuibacter physcomitrellae TaxID=1619308 RepID=UPI002175818A|nr:glycosyltransferase [Cnuibacter physcomitrellae]MCS5496115.1 glycosyltransferase [Cnuibacter physcomitrellae]